MVELAANPTTIRFRDRNISAVYWKGEKIWPETAAPPLTIQPIDPVNASDDWESEVSATAVVQPDGSIAIAAEEFDSLADFSVNTARDGKRYVFAGEISDLAGADVRALWFDFGNSGYFPDYDATDPLTDGPFSLEWAGSTEFSVRPSFIFDNPASFTLINYRFEEV